MDILSGNIPAGNRVCVLGGGMIGIDVADLLTSREKQVTIAEPGRRLAADLYALVGRELEKAISENQSIQLLLETEVKRIDDSTLICDQGGKTREIPFDHLVLALGRIPRPDPLEGIGEHTGEVIRIGDCRQPALIFDAIHAAYDAALTLGVPRASEPSGDDAVPGDVRTDASDLRSRIAGKIKGGTFGLEDIPDYLDLLVTTCNTHPKIQKKSKKANLIFQFQVEGGEDFWIRIDHGRFSSGQGTRDKVDVIIRMDRRIAPGIFSGQVNAAGAYMAKELAFIGPMKHGIAFRTWVNLVKQELGL